MKKIVKNIDGLKFVNIQNKEDSLFLSRTDYKFIIPLNLITDTINYLKKDFFCHKYKENCIFQYHNIYFDTDDFKFFNLHRQGKYNRIKIRVRNYKTGKKIAILSAKKSTKVKKQEKKG